VYVLPVQNEIKGDIVDKNIKHRVRTATGEISKSLSRQHTGEGPVKKIDAAYDYMSGLS
jgi:hypothetical protein